MSMLSRWTKIAGLTLAVALIPAAALSQEREPQQAQSASESRATSFQAVTGNAREEISGGTLLLAAYGSILALLLGYVGWLGQLQKGASKDIEALRAALDRKKND
jgi:hypothetical protein